ncbi:MAG: dihydroorotate dehydrogenase electron transfer subunit [Candidatus Peribacteraceae bacterium]|nr:dihydroorotate dehydrogenase electron transfer subunit [Candidatus Peribacteraceae bacterium]
MPISLQSRLPRTYRIVKVRKETAMVTSMTFDCSLGAKPGQFVMLWVPGVDEVPMSVAYDDGKNLRITFFAVGDTTKTLATMKKGDLVGLRGPFGTFYEWEPKQRLALVAGGYGASPMYFVAKEASAQGCAIDAIVGARSKDHLLYLDEFKGLPNTTLHVATDDGSQGHKGYNVDVLKQLLATGERPNQVFACGPERMLVAVSEVTAEAKIPSQLSLERYMKCGYGLCGNCTVDPLGIRLCVEGPVVKNETARKIAEFGKYHRDDLGKKQAF